MLNLAKAMEIAVSAARKAGSYQLQCRGSAQIDFKGLRELVTEVDRNSEVMIVEALLEAFPDHDVLAEEQCSKNENKSPYRWIVDPLDGTTNYAHSLPTFSIAIALEERKANASSEIVGGVVYAPALGEMFSAYKDGGARLNGEVIRVSPTKELINALLATGFAYVRHESPNDNLANWAHLSKTARDLRRLGSAALDLAYVAAGRFDGFWEYHLQAYDVAAGAFLVKEAGGRVTDTELGDKWLYGQRIIASNDALHDLLHKELVPVVPDGFIPL